VFTPGYGRITGRGFPHSGINGSKAVQHLTVAYRSRPRPSSAPDAKASTVCPYYLDGDQQLVRAATERQNAARESWVIPSEHLGTYRIPSARRA
jgi:hypothetical protein